MPNETKQSPTALEEYRKKAKYTAVCTGAAGIIFVGTGVATLMSATKKFDEDTADEEYDSFIYSSAQSSLSEAKTNADGMNGVGGICLAACIIAIICWAAANLLIAYKKTE